MADLTKMEMAQEDKFLLNQPSPQEFDANGLRFPLHWLHHVKTSVVLLSLERMMVYGDLVTSNMLTTAEGVAALKEMLGTPVPGDPLAAANATSIGNLALIVMSCENPVVVEKALSMLNELHDLLLVQIRTQFN